MHKPVLISAPTETPVSLAEAKAHLRVESNDEDGLITALVAAVTAYLDGYAGILGRAIVTQTWQQDFDILERVLRLPLPASGISSITVRSRDGTLSTIASENYALKHDARGSLVRFKDSYSLPGDLYETAAIAVTFVAGYGAAAAVPVAIKQAMLLIVAYWHLNREANTAGNSNNTPVSAEALLAPYRMVGV